MTCARAQKAINQQIAKVLEEIVSQRFNRANLETLKDMIENSQVKEEKANV